MPPIITVAEPLAIVSGGPTQVAVSPTRAAGIKLTITEEHPVTMGPPTWGTVPVTMGQVCISEILAAGGIFLVPFKFDIYS
jgi:hypothetical protein